MVWETGGQSLVMSYQGLKKWYLIPSCLTLRYVSRVKWSNPGKGLAPSPTLQSSSYWKGSLRVAIDYSRQLVIYIYRERERIWVHWCRLTITYMNLSQRKFANSLGNGCWTGSIEPVADAYLHQTLLNGLRSWGRPFTGYHSWIKCIQFLMPQFQTTI